MEPAVIDHDLALMAEEAWKAIAPSEPAAGASRPLPERGDWALFVPVADELTKAAEQFEAMYENVLAARQALRVNCDEGRVHYARKCDAIIARLVDAKNGQFGIGEALFQGRVKELETWSGDAPLPECGLAVECNLAALPAAVVAGTRVL